MVYQVWNINNCGSGGAGPPVPQLPHCNNFLVIAAGRGGATHSSLGLQRRSWSAGLSGGSGRKTGEYRACRPRYRWALESVTWLCCRLPGFREYPSGWQLLWLSHLERRPHCGAGVGSQQQLLPALPHHCAGERGHGGDAGDRRAGLPQAPGLLHQVTHRFRPVQPGGRAGAESDYDIDHLAE